MATRRPLGHSERMQLRHELSYDAPPDATYEVLADPAVREAVTAAQDVVSAVVSLTPVSSGVGAEHGVSTAWLEGDR